MNATEKAAAKRGPKGPERPAARSEEQGKQAREGRSAEAPVDRGSALSRREPPEGPVDEASDESFPASDPPSWSPSHVC